MTVQETDKNNNIHHLKEFHIKFESKFRIGVLRSFVTISSIPESRRIFSGKVLYSLACVMIFSFSISGDPYFNIFLKIASYAS